MSNRLIWSQAADRAITALRAEGASWDAIAVAVGVSRWSVIVRGRALGAERPPAPAPAPTVSGREPLPAGDAATWGPLVAGGPLAGTEFPWPPLALLGGDA